MLPTFNHEVLRKIGLTMCLLVVALAIAVLLGWAYNIQVLKSIFPGAFTFKANAAISTLLSGVALAFLYRKRTGEASRICIIILSLVVITISSLTLCEDFFSLDLGIDQFIFKDVIDSANIIPGRMGASIAYCYMLLGIALMVGSQSKFENLRLPIIATVSTTVLSIGVLTFISQIFAIIARPIKSWT